MCDCCSVVIINCIIFLYVVISCGIQSLLAFRGPSTALREVWKHFWLCCLLGFVNWTLERIWLCHVFWYFCCRSGGNFSNHNTWSLWWAIILHVEICSLLGAIQRIGTKFGIHKLYQDLQVTPIGQFLLRDAMHSTAYYVRQCPSIMFVYSVETSKYIFKIFSPFGSHTILVFPYQTWQFSDGDSPNRWGRQKSRFSMNQRLSDRWLLQCGQ